MYLHGQEKINLCHHNNNKNNNNTDQEGSKCYEYLIPTDAIKSQRICKMLPSQQQQHIQLTRDRINKTCLDKKYFIVSNKSRFRTELSLRSGANTMKQIFT